MLGKLLQELEKERLELAVNVFAFPPQDWPEFTRRQGEWNGLTSAIDRITAAIEGEDAEERRK